jgi:hypothetical protein
MIQFDCNRRKPIFSGMRMLTALLSLAFLSACASADFYRNPNMDFGSIQTVAVMPLMNIAKDLQANDRVRDVFITSLLATGSMYVLPPGEVARGASSAGMVNPASPTSDEVVKLCKILKVDAVITGTVKEYGETRSGSSSANLISMSMQMSEGQTGKVVWSATSTQGGITFSDRLLGGGGEAMNVVTEKAVNDILNKLFK